jgi:hypothetical protein
MAQPSYRAFTTGSYKVIKRMHSFFHAVIISMATTCITAFKDISFLLNRPIKTTSTIYNDL